MTEPEQLTYTITQFARPEGAYILHVIPDEDSIEHHAGEDECICGPDRWHVDSPEDGPGFLAHHWALDGRPRKRPYQAPSEAS